MFLATITKMLVGFIFLYIALTVALGIIATRLVRSSADYVLAGRRLPLFMATFVCFATWFGSETVLGASSTMAKDGLIGVIEEPFGAALCLILVGLFFARPLYRKNLLTMGDLYRLAYGRKVEVCASVMMVLSYFGWIAAQFLAIGIILHMVTGVPKAWAVLLGFVVVLFYTVLGGMWAVSLTDFFQTIMIIVGLVALLFEVSAGFRDIHAVLSTQPIGYFRFFPNLNFSDIVLWFSAWITIGLGSIPQQDVFQRTMASKNERVAVYSSVLAGVLYLTVATIPLVLAIFARSKYPELLHADPETMLPRLVVDHASLPVKVLFFGALLSAVMSTASAALLAPAAVLAENLLKPILPPISDRAFLWCLRACVLVVALLSLGLAYSGESIYHLVGSSSALSLVSLFVPLVASLHFGHRSPGPALASMMLGFGVWAVLEYVLSSPYALIVGFTISIVAFAVAGIGPKVLGDRQA